MTRKERFISAIEGKRTDKPAVFIPYLQIFTRDHWEEITGLPLHRLKFDNKDGNLEAAKIICSKLDVDFINAGLCAGRDYRGAHEVIIEKGKYYLADKKTGNKELIENNPAVLETKIRTIHNKKDVDEKIVTVKAEELIQSGRTDFLQNRVKSFGGEYFIISGVSAPFCEGYKWFGIADSLTAFYEENGLLHYFMKKLNARSIEMIRAYAKCGCDGVFIEETLASKDMISYRHFKELLPYTLELISEIKGLGMKCIRYFTGDISDRIEDLITGGADLIGFEENKKGFSIDIEEIAKASNGRIALSGNIDVYDIIEKASEDVLKREIERQYTAGMKYNNNRFLISPGSPMTPGTGAARAQRFIEIAGNIA